MGAVDADNFLGRSIVTLSWLAAGVVSIAAVVLVELNHNVFSWTPQGVAEYDVVAVLAWTLATFWVFALAPRTQTKLQWTTAVLVAAALAYVAVELIIGERPSPPGAVKPRGLMSPLWYRGARTTMLLVPGFVLVETVRRRARRRGSNA